MDANRRIKSSIRNSAHLLGHRRSLFHLRVAILLIFLLASWRFLASSEAERAQKEAPKPLMVKLSAAPRRVNGCLDVSMDRTNQSPQAIYIPQMGLQISTSAHEVSEDSEERRGLTWINIYGASDLVSWEAQPLAPGAAIHDHECLGPSIRVANLKKKTRRDIPLRGVLRIDAFYFLTEEDWKKNESQHEEMERTPPAQWNRIVIQNPIDVRIDVKIPCRGEDCASHCDAPPLILPGENRIFPDIWYNAPSMNARGKAVSEELAERFPGCSEPNAGPR